MPARRYLAPVCIATALLGSGCYQAHGLFGAGPGDRDSGVEPDAAPGPDGGLPDAPGFDAGMDATPVLDAGVDAGPLEEDGGWDSGGVDAAPPPARPPNPDTCRIEPEVRPFDDPVLEYRWPNGRVVQSSAVHVCVTPLVIDLEPDGDELTPELVFVSYPPLRRDAEPGVLRIVDPRTDTTISFPDTEAGIGVLEATGNLAAGDLDNDGKNEIVGIGTVAGTYAFRSDGTQMWENAWPQAADRGSRYGRSIAGAPTLADLEGDGTVEVVVGRAVIDGATGELRWDGADDTGRATNQWFGPISCVADLDGDGMQEVISGFTAFHHDGTVMWQADQPDGLCAVADLFEDIPGPEVVLVSNGYIRTLNGLTGELVWLRRLEGRVRLSLGGAPTVADFDGDGRPEVGVAHGAAYGVYDPECEAVGRPRGCTDEGLLWRTETSDASSSGTGSSVFDFNGDGRAEVIYNDEYYFRVYDGTSGDTLFQHRNSSRTRTENPTIADVDNDGDAEIIFSANAEARFIMDYWTDPGVEVWGDRRGSWVGSRRIWNQHAYHITNVEEDGTITSPERDSWTVLNAYRQNLREEADVLVVPDLWGGDGQYECVGRGRARLSVNVQNYGLERAGAGVVVAFYRGVPGRGGERVAEAVTTRALRPGESEVVSVEVDLGPEVTDWYGVIDDPLEPAGGAIFECREGNNRSLFWRPECP